MLPPREDSKDPLTLLDAIRQLEQAVAEDGEDESGAKDHATASGNRKCNRTQTTPWNEQCQSNEVQHGHAGADDFSSIATAKELDAPLGQLSISARMKLGAHTNTDCRSGSMHLR
jgi:hypothetical protein